MLLDGLVALVNFTIQSLPWIVGLYCLLSLLTFATGVCLLPVKLLIEWNPR